MKSPSSPPPRDLGNEINQILSQGSTLQQSREQLSPGQTGLDLSNLELSLLGGPGQTTTTYGNSVVARKGYYDANGNPLSKDQVRAMTPAQRVGISYKNAGEFLRLPTGTSTSPARRGLLDLYTNEIQPALRRGNAATSTANYADLRNLNPGVTALYDALQSDAEKGLKLGTRLDPESVNRITTGVRGDWAGRGVGNALPAGLDEALQLNAGGQDLLQRRRGTAAGVAQLGQDLYTLPALNLTSGAGGQSFLSGAGGYAKQPSILDSLGGYGSNLFGGNFDKDAQNRVNSANAANANTQLGMRAAGAIGLGLLACWAAREVFGAQDLRWLQFRNWLLQHAPAKFRDWYLTHGPRWAERLARDPHHKSIVKRWMERKIREAQHAV